MQKQEKISVTDDHVKFEEDDFDWPKKEEPEYLDQSDEYKEDIDGVIVKKTDLESSHNKDQLHTDDKMEAPTYKQEFEQSSSTCYEKDPNREGRNDLDVANSPVLEQKHEKIHWLECKHCSYRSQFSFALTKHFQRRHGGNSIADNQITKFWCYQSIEELNWYKCELCPYSTNITLALIRHKKVAHSLSRHKHWPDNLIELYQCDICSFRTKNKQNLKTHKNSHLPWDQIEWFQCDECDYCGKQKSTVLQHKLNVHLPENQMKWYNCKKCNFRCKTEPRLSIHVRNKHLSYDQSKWFKCDQCDYIAKTKYQLQHHQITMHLSDDTIKWYQCEQCQYRDKSQDKLEQHMALHSSSDKSTWFNCDQCCRRTKTKGHLKCHQAAVHSKSN